MSEIVGIRAAIVPNKPKAPLLIMANATNMKL
jgi:hypothetical protein